MLECVPRSSRKVVRVTRTFTDLLALLAFATAVVLSISPRATAQQYTIDCNLPGDAASTISSALPLSQPCSGTTAQGATYSGTGKILFNTPGEIALGSDLTWTGYDPYGTIAMNANIVGTITSATLPNGTLITLKSYIAGEGTNGTGPYGGTYSYSFSNGYSFIVYYSTLLTINGTVVICNDNQADPCNNNQVAAITVPYNPAVPSGGGGISAGPRTGTFQTSVGSPVNVVFEYDNAVNAGVPTLGTFSYKLDPGLTFAAANTTTGAPISGISIVLSDGTVIPVRGGVVNYSCSGFQSPFDVALSLSRKTNRAIPLKAQLLDSSNNLVTPSTLGTATPPVVNVSYQSGSSAAVDDTSLLDPIGASSSGNQFSFDSTTGTWWFNVATTPFTASGTYTVTMQSGDMSKYTLSSQCSGKFVRQ